MFFSSFVLFRAHSFWNTHLRKYLPPLDSVRLSEVRSYSLDNIFNFTFSFPKVPWLVNAVAEIWLHRNLLLVLLYYLTTPQLQTTGRPTERCLNVSKTIWSENFLWILLLIWCFDNIRCARRSSGTVHLAVSVQSDWDYLRVCFSDWPFWASIPLKKVPSIPQTRKKSRQSVETRLYLFQFQFRWRFPDKSTLYSKLYLIAFLVQFILGTLRTPLTDNRTEKFWEIASTPFWRGNLHWPDQMFTCDAHTAIYLRHFSV